MTSYFKILLIKLNVSVYTLYTVQHRILNNSVLNVYWAIQNHNVSLNGRLPTVRTRKLCNRKTTLDSSYYFKYI